MRRCSPPRRRPDRWTQASRPRTIPTIPPISPTPKPTSSPTPTSTGTTPVPAPTAPSGCAVDRLLVPSCGAWLGVAPGAHDHSLSRTQQLATFEANAGRKMDVMHVYHTDGAALPDQRTRSRWPGSPGASGLLFINWKPSSSKSWKAVAAGDPTVDAQIDKLSAHIKSTFPERFFLSIFHEPENDVNPTAGSGWTAADYRAMYRHVALRLKANGTDNAILTMVYMGFAEVGRPALVRRPLPGSRRGGLAGLRPVRLGGLGQQPTSPSWSTRPSARTPGWPGFYSWAQQRVPGKPMVLAEWGVAESASNPDGKADFFRGVVADAKNFPRLKAMVYFDSAVAHNGDTRIASTSQSWPASRTWPPTRTSARPSRPASPARPREPAAIAAGSRAAASAL